MAKKYRTTESYRDEVHALTDGEYVVVGEYKNVETPILHRHNCGFTWNVKPNHFVNTGSRCPKCFGNVKKTHAEYVAEVQSLVGDQFTVIGQYVNATTLIFHRHNAEGCGFQWRIQPNAFLRGNRCPRCQESKGARRVAKVLDSLGVSYSREFRFNDCRSIKPLPFDFCVQTESGPILIEYDGEQHHVPSDRFGGRRRSRGEATP